MFSVYYKEDEEFINPITVFAIRDKKGYPYFLIYEDRQWKYKSAKLFKPLEV